MPQVYFVSLPFSETETKQFFITFGSKAGVVARALASHKSDPDFPQKATF